MASNSDFNEQNVKIVEVKDYPKRNLLMGLFSLPLLFLISGVASVPFFLLGKLTIIPALLITIFSEIAVILIALSYTDNLKNGAWKKKLRLTGFTWKRFFAGTGIGTVLFVLLQVIATLISKFGGVISDSNTSTDLGTITGVPGYIVLLFVTPVLVPFIEEIFFRGLTFGFVSDALKNKGTTIANIVGVVISTIFFSVAHFQGLSSLTDAFLLIWVAVIAVVHALLVIKTDSICSSYGSHFMYNLLTALSLILATL